MIDPPFGFNVVLVRPEIPPNTGNIGRLCLATGCRLHLVGPLGFSIDDRALRRAGMDYWKEIDLVVWDDWDAYVSAHPMGKQSHLFSTKAQQSAAAASYGHGDYLIFGTETKGLPEELLDQHPRQSVALPMVAGVRSLNLATSVGAAVYLAASRVS